VAAELEDAGWIEQSIDAITIALVESPGPVEEVFRESGHSWTPVSPGTLDTVLDIVDGFDFDREPLLLDRLGVWHVLLAPNGFEFSYPGVGARVSRIGRFVSVFWNVNSVMRILVAERGEVRRDFDPLLIADSAGEPLPEEAGLPFGQPGAPLRAACLVLTERLTGQRFSRDWLFSEHPAVVLDRAPPGS
jgi:uncharacterized protein DUF6461